jgi:CRP-like cAMP-binding protein
MIEFLAKEVPVTELVVEAGMAILRQGERRGRLFVLESGKVEIIKSDQQICVVGEKGAVFGELSILLGCYQNATVRAIEPSKFKVVEDAERYLENNPKIAYFLARMLARRLALLDSHFTELKNKINQMQAEAAGLWNGKR